MSDTIQPGLTFLVVADTSGSMLEQPITSAQSALSEICYSLREIQRETGIPIFLGVLSFHETMRWECEPTRGPDFPIVRLAVRKKQNSRFYPVTSYRCLYDGLSDAVSSEVFAQRAEDPLYVCLITDGCPVDEDTFLPVATNTLAWGALSDAQRYVLLVGSGSPDETVQNTLPFVEYDRKRIFSGEEVPRLLTMVRMEAEKLSGEDRTRQDIFSKFGGIYQGEDFR